MAARPSLAASSLYSHCVLHRGLQASRPGPQMALILYVFLALIPVSLLFVVLCCNGLSNGRLALNWPPRRSIIIVLLYGTLLAFRMAAGPRPPLFNAGYFHPSQFTLFIYLLLTTGLSNGRLALSWPPVHSTIICLCTAAWASGRHFSRLHYTLIVLHCTVE